MRKRESTRVPMPFIAVAAGGSLVLLLLCCDEKPPVRAAGSPDTGAPGFSAPDARKPDQGVPNIEIVVPEEIALDQGVLAIAAPEEVNPDQGGPVPGTWVTIPAGTFTMGSPTSEPCQYSFNEDQHQVTLTHSFEIQSTEVTQGDFQALMSYNPSYFGPNGSGTDCGTNCPVEWVTWYEAVAYCNALSAQKGLAQCYTCSGSGASVTCSEASAYSGHKVYDCPGYRLPTEAEWEYAYRAGTTTAYYSGANDPALCTSYRWVDANLDIIGWYTVNSGDKPQPVAQKQPNAWFLYDMAGNVSEFCHDWYQKNLGASAVSDPWGSSSSGSGAPWGSARVSRGGGWRGHSMNARAASRGWRYPTRDRNSGLGFRCSRTK